jgi:hypothetical protein
MNSHHNPQGDSTQKLHPLFKVFLLFAIGYLVIEIARSGYHFGQWLQQTGV